MGKQLGKNNGDVSSNPGGTTSFLPQTLFLGVISRNIRDLSAPGTVRNRTFPIHTEQTLIINHPVVYSQKIYSTR
ncbi:hypothetical protein AV530_017754 [Patagioenas fasciata monilis]|uniref:Uncharacterized protein n=1 Tax=Patagioenas fasciata monilis TaxID=372326 RepID=A0A1V4KXJ0_PATFA|nr:hypothetical protein AV530_017754 [Patagioenas fasciata monilis]